VAVPNTKVRSSHAVTIKVGGITVGMIQSWAPNQARPTMPVYEINAATLGDMLERVPMNITGTTISVNRVDLYNNRMEQAWGPVFDINMLTDQANPFVIKERWQNPQQELSSPFDLSGFVGGLVGSALSPTVTGEDLTIVYSGCYFTSLGRNLAADGDRVVRVNASIDYVRHDII